MAQTDLFKRGDKVIIRSDLETTRRYGGVGVNESMASYGGKQATIKDVDPGVRYRLMEYSYSWTDDMFEPPTEEKMFESYINKRIGKKEYDRIIKQIKEKVDV